MFLAKSLVAKMACACLCGETVFSLFRLIRLFSPVPICLQNTESNFGHMVTYDGFGCQMFFRCRSDVASEVVHRGISKRLYFTVKILWRKGGWTTLFQQSCFAYCCLARRSKENVLAILAPQRSQHVYLSLLQVVSALKSHMIWMSFRYRSGCPFHLNRIPSN